MDASELNSNSYEVHLGFWTNWSYGAVKGGTITLTRQHGGFLIAFLAIYVGMVGKSFWRLGCFALHRYLSSAAPQDGLYHQRQAILRNSDTAQDGAWRLLMSMIAWRKRARRPILRLLPIILAAFLLAATFGVASIFSSNVTADTVNEVLLAGNRCGVLNRVKPNNVTAVYSLFKPYHSQLVDKFLNYGSRCYLNSSRPVDIDGCNLYNTPQLPLIANMDAPCPFNETICKLKAGNLILDTGRLHSQKHLGINSPPKEQFEMRLRHECAPLVTDGYSEEVETSVGPVVHLNYGEGSDGAYNMRPWTYEAPTKFPYELNGTGYLGTSRPEYSIGMTYAFAGQEGLPRNERLWWPIPELQRDDADVTVVYLSAPGIRFSEPVDDPWYSAHQNASTLYDQNNKTRPSWVQDSPVSAMACTTQIQYCNPNLPAEKQCEELRGTDDFKKKTTIPEIFPDESQMLLVNRTDFILTLDTAPISFVIGGEGVSGLRARFGLSYGYQGPLPSNQWQLEAEYWVQGELASIQDALVRAANGPPKKLDMFLVQPEEHETAARYLCRNQKIVSTKYSSFNVLGISLILFLGGLIIVLDMALEPIIARIKKRRYHRLMLRNQGYNRTSHPLHPVLEWSATNILQLQRLAHEEAGYGKWDGCGGDVPVTRDGKDLGLLDVEDVDHPVLKKKRNVAELRRSDTGFDTLVEVQSPQRDKKRVDEKDDLDMITVIPLPTPSKD